MQRTHVRLDIQGLRGLAVTMVVLDHAFAWPTGGFFGVDSFFVISGFVITMGLLAEHERTGRIALGRFAVRRAKRLAPTSVLAVLVVVATGTLLLGTGRGRDLALDGLTSVFGVANWRFASAGTGYFDQGAPASPLQHFWSLAVEEQFYLVLPLLLLLLLPRTSGRRPVLAVVVVSVLTALSLGYAFVATATTPDAAYFVTTTRAWELLLGVALAFVVTRGATLARRPAIVVSVVGAAALLGSMVFGTEQLGVPAPLSLLPTVGTALVIWAGAGAHPGPVARLLSWRPLTWLGDISYSLYVWHWPILVVVPLVADVPVAVLVAVAVLIAVANDTFIETPFRSPRPERLAVRARSTQRGIALLGAATAAAVLTCSVALQRQEPLDIPAALLEAPAAADADEAPIDPALADRERVIRDSIGIRTWPEPMTPTKAELTDVDYGPGLTGTEEWKRVLGCGVVAGGRSVQDCTFGDPERPTVMLVGDSTGAFAAPGMVALAERADNPWNVVNATSFACPFTAQDVAHVEGADCEAARARSAAWIDEVRPEVLLVTNLAAAFEVGSGKLDPAEQAEGVQDAITAAGDAVGTAAIVPPNPSGLDIRACLASVKGPSACSTRPVAQPAVASAMRTAAEAHERLFVDTRSVWCLGTTCPAVIDGQAVRFDAIHVLPRAAVAAAPALEIVLLEAGVFDGIEGAGLVPAADPAGA